MEARAGNHTQDLLPLVIVYFHLPAQSKFGSSYAVLTWPCRLCLHAYLFRVFAKSCNLWSCLALSRMMIVADKMHATVPQLMLLLTCHHA
jgi:hypothetical protein